MKLMGPGCCMFILAVMLCPSGVDADTLGYAGFDWASGSYDINDNMRATIYQLPVTGTADSLFVHLLVDANVHIRCALYDYVDSSFIDSTDIRALSTADTARYFGFAFQNSAEIPGGTSVMMCVVGDAGARLKRRDSVGVIRTYAGGFYNDMWPSKLTGWTEVADMTYGMFMTYAPACMEEDLYIPRRRRLSQSIHNARE